MSARCARCRATREQHDAGPVTFHHASGSAQGLLLCPAFVQRAPWWLRALTRLVS